MSRKKKNARGATAAILVGVFVVTGLAAYVVNGPARQVPDDQQRQSRDQEPAAATPEDNKPKVSVSTESKGEAKDVVLYAPTYKDGELGFEKTKGVAGEGKDAVIKVVNDYLSKIEAVPAAGRLVDVEQTGGIAILKFTPEFENGYGSDDERTILVGILTALGQFPEIKKAQFTIEGRQLESLGHFDLTVPQDVIR